MAQSINDKKRKFQGEVGPLGKVDVWPNREGALRHQVKCRQCRWSSRSDGSARGQGSSWFVALHQWGEHLEVEHGVELDGWNRQRTGTLIAGSERRAKDASKERMMDQGYTSAEVEDAEATLARLEREMKRAHRRGGHAKGPKV